MPQSRPSSSLRSRGAGVALVLAVLAAALLSMVQDVAANLSADGVQQSVMAIQDPDLFYWGQDRLAALPSWLTSPVGDPSLNLWAVLLFNGAAFYTLVATLAWVGVREITGRPSPERTLVAFLVLVAVIRLMFAPLTRYVLSLEGQPYSTSHLLALWAFLLWRRGRWPAAAVAAALVWLAVGINAAAVLMLALLAAVSLLRERTWRALARWATLGLVCVLAQSTWIWLAGRFGGTPGPFPEPALPYYEFTAATLRATWIPALEAILGSLRPGALVLVPLALFAAVAMTPAWRRPLARLLGVAIAYALGYGLLFASNGWVAMNGAAVRYFAPILMVLVLVLAGPLACWVIGALEPASPGHPSPGRRRTALAAAGLALVLVVGAVGPVRSPDRADILQATRPTADFALDHDIRFVSGWYWAAFPTLHQTLDGGRQDVFIAAYKSGGDLADYQEAFTDQLRSKGAVRALCVDWSVAECADFLAYWTAPGWRDTGQTCPAPPAHVGRPDWNLLHGPPEVGCRILVHDDAQAPLTVR